MIQSNPILLSLPIDIVSICQWTRPNEQITTKFSTILIKIEIETACIEIID